MYISSGEDDDPSYRNAKTSATEILYISSDSDDTISDRKESVINSEPNNDDDDEHLGYEYVACYILRERKTLTKTETISKKLSNK